MANFNLDSFSQFTDEVLNECQSLSFEIANEEDNKAITERIDKITAFFKSKEKDPNELEKNITELQGIIVTEKGKKVEKQLQAISQNMHRLYSLSASQVPFITIKNQADKDAFQFYFNRLIHKKNKTELLAFVKKVSPEDLKELLFTPKSSGGLPIVSLWRMMKRDNNPFIKKLREQYKDTIDTLKSLHSLSESFFQTPELDLIILTSLRKRIQEHIESLKKDSITEIGIYEKRIARAFDNLDKRLDDARDGLADVRKNGQLTHFPIQSNAKRAIYPQDVQSLAVLEAPDLIPILAKPNYTKATHEHEYPIRGYILDKVISVADGKLGSSPVDEGKKATVVPLLLAMKQIESDFPPVEKEESALSLEEQQQQSLAKLLKQLEKSLEIASKWDTEKTPTKQQYKLMAYEISSLIKKQIASEIEHPILIPYEILTSKDVAHGICIGIEREAGDPPKARVSFYNTGIGSHPFHPYLKNNRYQTNLVIEHVPYSDLENPDVWETFLWQPTELAAKPQEAEKIVASFYQAFFRLCHRGTKEAPSKNSHDYEQAQMHGTCRSQRYLAFVRDSILRKVPGSSPAKMGAYKLVKGRVILAIADTFLPTARSVNKKFAQQKLSKVKGMIALQKVAADKQAFEKYCKQLFNLLDRMNEPTKDIFRRFPTTTSFERFSFVKQASKIISKNRIFNNAFGDFGDAPDVLQASDYLFSEIGIIRKQIHNLLDANLKKKDWDLLARNFINICLSTSQSYLAFDWLEDQENEDQEDLFEDILQIIKDKGMPKEIYLNFIIGFKEMDRADLAERMEKEMVH